MQGIVASSVDEVEDKPCALDVAEEVEAEARALVRAFDQARDVRHHEPLPADVHDAQVGLQRREGVGADLRAGSGDGGSRVDLPAFGRPAMPTSASSLRSRRSRTSSPRWPRWAIRGAWWTELANRVLPQPPAASPRDHELLRFARQVAEVRLGSVLLDGP